MPKKRKVDSETYASGGAASAEDESTKKGPFLDDESGNPLPTGWLRAKSMSRDGYPSYYYKIGSQETHWSLHEIPELSDWYNKTYTIKGDTVENTPAAAAMPGDFVTHDDEAVDERADEETEKMKELDLFLKNSESVAAEYRQEDEQRYMDKLTLMQYLLGEQLNKPFILPEIWEIKSHTHDHPYYHFHTPNYPVDPNVAGVPRDRARNVSDPYECTNLDSVPPITFGRPPIVIDRNGNRLYHHGEFRSMNIEWLPYPPHPSSGNIHPSLVNASRYAGGHPPDLKPTGKNYVSENAPARIMEKSRDSYEAWRRIATTADAGAADSGAAVPAAADAGAGVQVPAPGIDTVDSHAVQGSQIGSGNRRKKKKRKSKRKSSKKRKSKRKSSKRKSKK